MNKCELCGTIYYNNGVKNRHEKSKIHKKNVYLNKIKDMKMAEKLDDFFKKLNRKYVVMYEKEDDFRKCIDTIKNIPKTDLFKLEIKIDENDINIDDYIDSDWPENSHKLSIRKIKNKNKHRTIEEKIKHLEEELELLYKKLESNQL